MDITVVKSLDRANGKHLEINADNIIIITFYIFYANRYFKGGIYEDKILS